MSRTEIRTDGLTPEEFETALADLIRTANQSDVEVPCSLDVTNGVESTEWMVEITQIDRHR